MKTLRALTMCAAFFGGLAAMSSCSPATPKCSPSSCQGCCDSTGACQAGTAPTACGLIGNSCEVCLLGQSCGAGFCNSGTGGGTGGGTTGGGTGGGTTGGGTGGGTTGGGAGGGTTGGGTGGGTTGGGTGGGTTGGGTGGGATGGGTSGNEVTGHSIRTFFLLDGGTETSPLNFAAYMVGAWITEDGGAVYRAGVGSPNGTFVIPNVPQGQYLLRFQTGYYVASSRVVDFDYKLEGRSDALAASIDPTPVNFSVSDLTPWTVNDSLTLYSFNAGATLTGFDPYLSTPPAPATTLLTGTSLNYFLYSNALRTPMIQSSRGDDAVLIQQTFLGDAGVGVVSTSRSLNVSGLDMADGQTATLFGAMTTPPAASLSYDYRAADFITAAAQLNPTTGTPFVVLATYLTPKPVVSDGDGFAEGVRVFAFAPYSPPSTVAWNNPYPANWNTMGLWVYRAPLSRQLGSATPQSYHSQLRRSMNLADFTTQPLQPTLGPPTNLRINGADLLADQTGVGTQPTVTWAAPTLGTPRRYRLAIDRLTVQTGATRIAQSLSVDTPNTSFTPPPGMLIAGQAYVITVAAFSTPTQVDPGPFFNVQLPVSEASMVSGIIRP